MRARSRCRDLWNPCLTVVRRSIFSRMPYGRKKNPKKQAAGAMGGRAKAQAGHVPPTDPPVVGSRVRVHWPAEHKWYRGSVATTQKQDGRLIFHVVYDDGDEGWVAAFGEDQWAFADAAAAAAAAALSHGSYDRACKLRLDTGALRL